MSYRAFLVAMLLAACAPSMPAPSPEVRLAEDVVVQRIAPGVWLHVTTGTSGGRVYPANGLLVETDSGAILVDGGWTDRHAEVLMRWASERGHPVRTAIVTHAHEDRTGGVAALRREGVRVLGHPLTAELAAAEGRTGIEPLAAVTRAAVPLKGVEVYYPGPGHAHGRMSSPEAQTNTEALITQM